jgi:prepilin peptidase CpaA
MRLTDKECLSFVCASMADLLSVLLPLALATLLIVAALGDVRRYRIPNQLNLAMALLALPWWLVQSGLQLGLLWQIMLPQMLLIGGMFLLMLLAMHYNLFGGGDAKMLLALAFWFPLDAYLSLLTVMALAGGVLSLALLLRQRLASPASGTTRKLRVPYGVAIAAGGLLQTSQLIVKSMVA